MRSVALAAGSAVLGGFEHALDLAFVEDARKRPLEARARQRGRRIVAAQAVVDEEAEEAPQRRRPPRNRRRRELGPGRAEPRQIVGRRRSQRPGRLRRALEVVAIGGERMARGAGFGGQHVEEAVDQRAVVRSHVRDSVSAAIMRAVKSWPVRFSAEIA